jgi:uncharacterized membrane protein YbhN (UPF0104 family)
MNLASIAQGIERGSVSLRAWGTKHAKPLVVAGFVLFLALCALAIHEYSTLDLHPKLWLIVPAAVIAAPIMAVLNAFEYSCGARIADHHPSFNESMTVSITGSAANMLPIPGGLVVRNYAMLSGGATVAGAVHGTVATGAAWIGVTGIVVGIIVMWTSLAVGIPIAAAGVVLCAVVVVLARRRVGMAAARPIVVQLLFVEIGTVIVEIGRYWLVLAALGAHPDLLRTMPLVGANVISAATLVFPGGLGVREALAGAFSTATKLPAAVGIAASALDRVALTIMFVVLAAVSAALRRSKRVSERTGS